MHPNKHLQRQTKKRLNSRVLRNLVTLTRDKHTEWDLFDEDNVFNSNPFAGLASVLMTLRTDSIFFFFYAQTLPPKRWRETKQVNKQTKYGSVWLRCLFLRLDKTHILATAFFATSNQDILLSWSIPRHSRVEQDLHRRSASIIRQEMDPQPNHAELRSLAKIRGC